MSGCFFLKHGVRVLQFSFYRFEFFASRGFRIVKYLSLGLEYMHVFVDDEEDNAHNDDRPSACNTE